MRLVGFIIVIVLMTSAGVYFGAPLWAAWIGAMIYAQLIDMQNTMGPRK